MFLRRQGSWRAFHCNSAGVFSAGREVPGYQVGITHPLAGTKTEQVLQMGRTMVWPDIALDPKFVTDESTVESNVESYVKSGLNSYVLLPLKSNAQTVASMGVFHRQVGAYGPKGLRILDRLAVLIAPK